jgi:hypothetical protein
MTGPWWLAAGFAALMLLIAAGSACRLSVGRLRGLGTEPDADAVHVVMGVAMAGMFEPRLNVAPAAAWRVVFAAAAAWFVWQAVRARRRAGPGGRWCAHPAPHAVECAAMIYMLVPAGRSPGTAMPGMSQSAMAGNPAIALVLALFMLGYLLWSTDRLASMSRSRPDATVNPPPATTARPGSGVGTLTLTSSAPTGLVATAQLAPRFAYCCKIAMSIGMGYMLITML